MLRYDLGSVLLSMYSIPSPNSLGSISLGKQILTKDFMVTVGSGKVLFF